MSRAANFLFVIASLAAHSALASDSSPTPPTANHEVWLSCATSDHEFSLNSSQPRQPPHKSAVVLVYDGRGLFSVGGQPLRRIQFGEPGLTTLENDVITVGFEPHDFENAKVRQHWTMKEVIDLRAMTLKDTVSLHQITSDVSGKLSTVDRTDVVREGTCRRIDPLDREAAR